MISVPYKAYVCSSGIPELKAVGFEIDERLLRSNNADAAIKLAAGMAGIPFYSVTDIFRKACLTQELYYKYDGHFNKKGNLLFAEALASFFEASM